jgi:hypothetical protein
VIYGWAIEYEVGPAKEIHCCFIKNDGFHNMAYVMQRAADLHGQIVTLFAEARTT